MSAALFLVLLLSAGQHGGQGSLGCWSSCQRHVQDQALRARLCQLCVTTGRADSWVLELGRTRGLPAQEGLRSALTDPDWRVRWAVLRAQAKARGHTEPRTLADWVAEAPARDEVLACLTAARAAASTGKSTASYLKEAGAKGGTAAARVWARRDAIREALEVEVYSEQPVLRGEALSHLATFLGRPPARVLLESMARRPEAGDVAAASALLSVAEKKGSSVGRMLLAEAKPPDQALINRLFAVYSADLEKLQKGLASLDVTERRATVQSLWRYGPLAQRELERALVDSEAQVRRLAARGLAEAEGLSLMEAARRKIWDDGASLDTRCTWMDVVATEKTCEPFLLEVAHNTDFLADTRGEAAARLADCDGDATRRFKRLAPLLKDQQAAVRAGAVRALVLPRSPEVDAAVAAALEDSMPEVVAAALGVVGRQRQVARVESVVNLLGSPHADVREGAARALEWIGRPQHVKHLAQMLAQDSVASVRVAAAETLAILGGPFAASALSQAAAKDPDSHVQHVARRGLARLGFRPP
ncbi:HEAT repeat domain-containing protein [Archangium sp. Cb G35]|uniref:HEAT repeat domain-containing protein n=1 Tax=Archangium sp. Cb G35 TaxID=1920190 RepID=UPI0009FA1A7A|nr:HEAT repeat domain-containing protein [Archangium sp. Cb G35]